MASTSETGHAKNVANFEKLIINITALGTDYNPSKAGLTLDNLNAQLTAAKAVIATVNSAGATYKNALSTRNAAFLPLSKLITRINNALKASDTTPQVKETVQSLVRKIQGRRATAKLTEEEKKAATESGKEIVEISSSQMSFDSRLDNFDKLIKLLATVPAYAPNEADLKTTSLITLYDELKAKNTAVTTADTSLSNARISRSDLLYKPSTGMVDISVDVKTYIKSVYGSTSQQYKAISNLKFISYN